MRIASLVAVGLAASALSAQPTRPFGTLREQADRQQRWLQQRLTTVLPALMRKHGIDMWVVPMREYNEDAVFTSLVSPTTLAARRRTIYVFFDKCAAATLPVDRPAPSIDRGATESCLERIALAGTSPGGLYEAVRSTRAAPSGVRAQQAELWRDQQWLVLKDVIEQRNPK